MLGGAIKTCGPTVVTMVINKTLRTFTKIGEPSPKEHVDAGHLADEEKVKKLIHIRWAARGWTAKSHLRRAVCARARRPMRRGSRARFTQCRPYGLVKIRWPAIVSGV